MSEKVVGITFAIRPAFMKTIYEILLFTPDRVIVTRYGEDSMFGGGVDVYVMGSVVVARKEAAIKARKEKKEKEKKEQELTERLKKFFELPLEDFLRADKHNFAIPNSEITKVERKSRGRFHITTSKKKHKWYSGIVISDKMLASGDIPYGKVDWKDYENVLRPIFGDKLSVKK